MVVSACWYGLGVVTRGPGRWPLSSGKLISSRIYRDLCIVLDSPTIALTSLNEGVCVIAREKYTKYVRRTRTMEYAGSSSDHSLRLYQYLFFLDGRITHRLGYHFTPSQRMYSSGRSAQRT